MKIFICGFVLLCLTGCSTWITVPSGHSRTPEVAGSDFSASLGLQSHFVKRAVYPIPNYVYGNQSAAIKGSADFTQNNFEDILESYVPLQASIDFGKRASFFLNSGGGGVQFQILGEPAKTAKKGNFALSLVYALYQTKKSGQYLKLGMDTATINGELLGQSEVYSIVFGYRFDDTVGIGLNLYSQPVRAWGSGTISTGGTSTVNTNSTDLGFGPILYGGFEHFQFSASPTWVQLEEPVRNQKYIVTFWNARISYMF